MTSFWDTNLTISLLKQVHEEQHVSIKLAVLSKCVLHQQSRHPSSPSSQLFYNWLRMLGQLHKTRSVVQPSRKCWFGIKRFITGFLNERRGRIWEIATAVALLEDIWRGSRATSPLLCTYVRVRLRVRFKRDGGESHLKALVLLVTAQSAMTMKTLSRIPLELIVFTGQILQGHDEAAAAEITCKRQEDQSTEGTLKDWFRWLILAFKRMM